VCGIAGIIGLIGPANQAALTRMSEALAHRGPNGSGFWSAPPDQNGWGAMLAHRRLAILDLSSAGEQPMHDPETGDVIAFNGEIYNYLELRGQLGGRGQHLRSSGDTAVMLRVLGVSGSTAVAEFRGMFAFAHWNYRSRQLMLSRDQLGIKPLYFVRNPDPRGTWAVAFASEVRALLASGLVTGARINADMVASFVWNGFTTAPETAVVGVETLLPGESRVLTSSGSEVQRWRDSPLSGVQDEPQVTEEELAESLAECVRLHLASDVPLGVFLSGGIDSSVIANLVQKASSQPVHTFTLAFEETQWNEGLYARKIAEQIGTTHNETVLTQSDFLRRLDGAFDGLDQPSIDGMNMYVMSHLVAEAGFKVALMGSGGDELFGGYTSFRDLPTFASLNQTFRLLPEGLKVNLAKAITKVLQPFSHVPPQTRWAKLPDMIASGNDMLRLYQIAYAIFLPSYQKRLLRTPSPGLRLGLHREFASFLEDELDGRSSLEKVGILEQRLFLGERLLRDTDAMSMSASIEVRLPFVDQKLVRLVNRMEPNLRFLPIRKKACLQRIGLRGLNADDFDRPKSGFVLPFNDWLHGGLGMEVGQVLNDRDSVLSAGLEPKEVAAVWKAFQRRMPGLYWTRVWSLYVLVRWAKKFHLSV